MDKYQRVYEMYEGIRDHLLKEYPEDALSWKKNFFQRIEVLAELAVVDDSLSGSDYFMISQWKWRALDAYLNEASK